MSWVCSPKWCWSSNVKSESELIWKWGLHWWWVKMGSFRWASVFIKMWKVLLKYSWHTVLYSCQVCSPHYLTFEHNMKFVITISHANVVQCYWLLFLMLYITYSVAHSFYNWRFASPNPNKGNLDTKTGTQGEC